MHRCWLRTLASDHLPPDRIATVVAQQDDPDLSFDHAFLRLGLLGKRWTVTDKPSVGDIEEHRRELAVLRSIQAGQPLHQRRARLLQFIEHAM